MNALALENRVGGKVYMQTCCCNPRAARVREREVKQGNRETHVR